MVEGVVQQTGEQDGSRCVCLSVCMYVCVSECVCQSVCAYLSVCLSVCVSDIWFLHALTFKIKCSVCYRDALSMSHDTRVFYDRSFLHIHVVLTSFY
jgi:hypothetical protein